MIRNSALGHAVEAASEIRRLLVPSIDLRRMANVAVPGQARQALTRKSFASESSLEFAELRAKIRAKRVAFHMF